MKYVNGLAWVIAILAVGAIAAHWSQIQWYLANKTTVDQAVETADALKQTGVLK
jgi:hypothetical protein